MDFLDTVRATVAARSMLPAGGRVLVGLSGGADSVVLTDTLVLLGYRVSCCHFEHGIRGERSVADMEFARRFCAERALPLVVGRGDSPARAAARGISLEAAARELRYEFFARAMAETGCGVCATAHHLNDHVETLLLRLTRGAVDGLEGIPYVNGPFIRPLRDVTRPQIEQRAALRGLPFVTDETNADRDIPRNLVRLEAVPLLERLNPRACRNIARSLALLCEQAAPVRAEAEALHTPGGLSIEALAAASRPAARIAARRFAMECGCAEPEGVHIDAILALRRTGAMLDLPGCRLICAGGAIRKAAEPVPPFDVPLALAGSTCLPAGVLEVSPLPCVPADPATPPLEQVFDADKLASLAARCGGLRARSRRAGDTIRPIGTGTKKLKDYFIDARIPADLRSAVPLVAAGGSVLWAVGWAASGDIAVDADTKRAISIKYIPGRK